MRTRLAAVAAALAAVLASAPAASASPGLPGHTGPRPLTWTFVGDSLTNGFLVERGQAYPAVLDRMLPGMVADVAAVNGSCLVSAGCWGQRPWVETFEERVWPTPAAHPARVLVLLGVNDLCRPDVTPAAWAAGYAELAATARRHGTPITFLTMLPHGVTNPRCEADAATVNAWLRGSRLDVVDVGAALATPDGWLRPEYDTGDGLHINAAGDAAVARVLAVWAWTGHRVPGVTPFDHRAVRAPQAEAGATMDRETGEDR